MDKKLMNKYKTHEMKFKMAARKSEHKRNKEKITKAKRDEK